MPIVCRMGSLSTSQKVVIGMAAFQMADAAAVVGKLPLVTQSLDRIDCPPAIRHALPFVKGASAIGLLCGLRVPRLGRLTAGLLVAYFAFGFGFHVKAKEAPQASVPAGVLGLLCACLWRSAFPTATPS